MTQIKVDVQVVLQWKFCTFWWQKRGYQLDFLLDLFRYQVYVFLPHIALLTHIKDQYDNEEIINVYNSAMEEVFMTCMEKQKNAKPMLVFLGGVDKDVEHN
jgi:hypothetical protein